MVVLYIVVILYWLVGCGRSLFTYAPSRGTPLGIVPAQVLLHILLWPLFFNRRIREKIGKYEEGMSTLAAELLTRRKKDG